MKLSLLIGAVLYFSVLAFAARDRDLVTSLPKQVAQFKEKLYSGFYWVSARKQIHYAYLESQDKPETDPVIIFFLGGPGVATLSIGLFGGLGSLMADNPGNATLIENPNNWNKKANLLFIDNPTGVGYSHGDLPRDDLHSDLSASNDAFSMVKQFYIDWFPLRQNPVYISGISYGGIYAPYLAW